MEDKVVSFEKGIHREPSLGAVGELSDCVNLYSEGTEMKMMPHVEGVRNVPEGWVCRYVHENGGDYSHLVMVGEKSVESDDEATADAVETEAAVDASANAQETVVVDGGSADGEASGTVAVVGWLPMEYESGEEVVEIMELGSGESIYEIGSMGNVLIVGTSERMYYYLWNENGYIDSGLDDLECPEFLYALKGKYVATEGDRAVLTNIGSSATESQFSAVATVRYSRSSIDKEDVTQTLQGTFKKDIYYKITVTQKNYKWFQVFRDSGLTQEVTSTYADSSRSEMRFKLSSDANALYVKVYDFKSTSFVVTVYESNVNTEFAYSIDKTDETNVVSIIGSADKFINEQAVQQNKFMYPFFVRAAIKLKDGTYIKPSAPTLMLPNTGVVPNIYIQESNAMEAKSTLVSAVVCDLEFGDVNANLINELEKRSSYVQGIVIAVSAPIYTYDQGATSAKLNSYLYVSGYNGNYVKGFSCADIGSGYQCQEKMAIDRTNGVMPEWNITLPPTDDLEKKILDCSNFYIIKEYSINELKALSGMTKVNMDEGTLSGLVGRRRLDDNIISLNKYKAKNMYVYNRRLTLGSLTKTAFCGYAPSKMNGLVISFGYGTDETKCYITGAEVYIADNNEVVKVSVYTGATMNIADFRWFYYPNSKAKYAIIYGVRINADDEYEYVSKRIELTEHPSMNGAYYYRGLDISYFELYWSVISEEKYNASKYTNSYTINYANEIISSHLNNPFSLDSATSAQIGMGEVQKLISNTRALSQGQFGQHPVLAFCSDGIWAMAVSSEGGFSAVQPVSRDVVSNVESITQTDSAVAFVTERGLMMIDGSEVKELCQFMDNRENFDVEGACAQLVDGFEELFVEESDSWLDVLREAKLVYDYQNSLLWVMPQQDVDDEDLSRNKWYAVSLKNGEVYGYVCPDVSGRGLNRFYGPVSVVPGYPQSYMQMKNVYRRNNVVASRMALAKFGYVRGNGKSKGWLVTRAIPFGDAYAMKMLYDMKVEKMFGEGSSAKVAVFVSNDRVHWGRLTSMKGRSFKWYRFAVFCDMSDMDRLTGLVCRIDERRGNKLR